MMYAAWEICSCGPSPLAVSAKWDAENCAPIPSLTGIGFFMRWSGQPDLRVADRYRQAAVSDFPAPLSPMTGVPIGKTFAASGGAPL